MAKLLTCAGRTDIEIGVGIATQTKSGQMRPGFQATWSSSFDLGQYPKVPLVGKDNFEKISFMKMALVVL